MRFINKKPSAARTEGFSDLFGVKAEQYHREKEQFFALLSRLLGAGTACLAEAKGVCLNTCFDYWQSFLGTAFLFLLSFLSRFYTS